MKTVILPEAWGTYVVGDIVSVLPNGGRVVSDHQGMLWEVDVEETLSLSSLVKSMKLDAIHVSLRLLGIDCDLSLVERWVLEDIFMALPTDKIEIGLNFVLGGQSYG